jgi:hypothetical protein
VPPARGVAGTLPVEVANSNGGGRPPDGVGSDFAPFSPETKMDTITAKKATINATTRIDLFFCRKFMADHRLSLSEFIIP